MVEYFSVHDELVVSTVEYFSAKKESWFSLSSGGSACVAGWQGVIHNSTANNCNQMLMKLTRSLFLSLVRWIIRRNSDVAGRGW